MSPPSQPDGFADDKVTIPPRATKARHPACGRLEAPATRGGVIVPLRFRGTAVANAFAPAPSDDDPASDPGFPTDTVTTIDV